MQRRLFIDLFRRMVLHIGHFMAICSTLIKICSEHILQGSLLSWKMESSLIKARRTSHEEQKRLKYVHLSKLPTHTHTQIYNLSFSFHPSERDVLYSLPFAQWALMCLTFVIFISYHILYIWVTYIILIYLCISIWWLMTLLIQLVHIARGTANIFHISQTRHIDRV